jgi:cysteine-rich repeat protein
MVCKLWGVVGLSILLALAGCDSGVNGGPNTADGRKDAGPTVAGRDSGGFVPGEQPDDVVMLDPNNAANVMGLVADVNGNHLPGAIVELGGKQVMSGPDGMFELGELTANPELPLLVTLDGYSSKRARVDVLREQDNFVKVVLAENEVMELADVAKGGEVKSANGVSINLPPGAVVDEDGNTVEGPIEVKIALLNDRDEIAAAPGNMMAQVAASGGGDRAEMVESPLESFGMVEVNLVASDGRKVNLKGDQEVALRFPLAANHSFKLGDDIPLWHYDEKMNLWNLVGNGVVQDDNTFLANVTHFSWWNADQVLTKTCVIGRVLDGSGNPVPAAQMSGEGRSYLGNSHAVTGEDGAFCMEARVSSVIELSTSVRFQGSAQALAVRVNTPRAMGSCGQPSSCFMIDDLVAVAVADAPRCDPAQCPQEPGKVACCTTDLGPCDYVVNGDCGGSADGSWDPEPMTAGVEAVPGVPMPAPPGSSDAGTPMADAGTDAGADAGMDAGTDAGTNPTPSTDAAIDAAVNDASVIDASTPVDAGMDGSVVVPDASTMLDSSTGGDSSVPDGSTIPDSSVPDGGDGSVALDRCPDVTALLDYAPVSGTTVGSALLNDWWDGGQCNAHLPGYERVYAIEVPAGATLRARAVGDRAFATVISTHCADVIGSCVAGNDRDHRPSWTNESQTAATVFVTVDNAELDAQAAFTLFLSNAEPSCGDNLLDWEEQCDDGNADNGDGCDELCAIEPGHACPPSGACHAVVCGDGVVDYGGEFSSGYEQCDDGGSAPGDGCSSSCTLEPGYVCQPGLPCREIVCGDGIIDRTGGASPGGGGVQLDGGAQLDGGTSLPDGGGTPSDGGSTPTDGGKPSEPSDGGTPMPMHEQCDDENDVPGDGCSVDCQVEPNHVCSGEPSVCSVRPAGDSCENPLPLAAGSHDLATMNRDYFMGQGPDIAFSGSIMTGKLLIVSGTATFSGTAVLSDATSCPSPSTVARHFAAGQPFSFGFEGKGSEAPAGSSTSVVLWFAADAPGASLLLTLAEPISASPRCGDRTVSASLNESCDDGNVAAGDGCNAQCQREPGYSCPFSGGACQPVACDDGSTHWPYEDCEDGNTVAGDGCSSSCRTEPGYLCDWTQMQCELRASGDLCNNALALASGLTQGQYGMSGMTGDRLCVGGVCEDAPTRWFSFVQQAGEVTNAVFAADFYGDVDFFDLACPADEHGASSQVGGSSLWQGETSQATLFNPMPQARTVWMRVSSNGASDGSFHMSLKTGLPGCGDGFVQYGGGPGPGPGDGGTQTQTLVGPVQGSMERCDDMNSVAGDGCSASCQIELGFRCPSNGGACTQMTCGDGIVDRPPSAAFEACDDGNTATGDGCDASCELEASANCTGQPSSCSATMAGDLCGNALPLPIGSSSYTIDAFTPDHDDPYGASSAQTAWFAVQLQPRQVMSLTSSAAFSGNVDIYTVGANGCDQRFGLLNGQLGMAQPLVAHNLGSTPMLVYVRVMADSHGGSASGSFTLGSTVFVPAQDCNGAECVSVVCGDGVIHGTEQCDDDNTSGGDGCSAICTLEPTHVCSGQPSACVAALPGDGCSNALPMSNGSFGFSGYAPEPSCMTICGGASRWFVVQVPAWHTLSLHVAGNGTQGYTRVYDLGASCALAEASGSDTVGPSDNFGPGGDMRRALVNDSPIARTVGLAVVSDAAPSSATFTLAHSVEPIGCGDGHADHHGQYGTPEACDDGALATGDGCGPTCQPEPGWACDFQGHCVEVVCGDGLVNGDEECDDSDALGGDGCSAGCTLEAGYVCGGEPYACHETQSGDTCENAEPLVDGSYDLSGYLPDLGCRDVCSGPDRWFTLSVPQGQTLTAMVSSSTMTGEVRIYDLTWGGCGSVGGGYFDNFSSIHAASAALVNHESQPRLLALVVSQQPGSAAGGSFSVSHSLAATGCGDGFVDRSGWDGPPEACDDGNGSSADGCSTTCQIEQGWVCGNAMPSQCAQPPAGDMCESAQALVNGSYTLDGFSAECALFGCSADRFFAATVPAGELLIVDATSDAPYASMRLWDLTQATCGDATQLTGSPLSNASPAQLVWLAPAGGLNVLLQLEAPSTQQTTTITLDARTGMPACGDGYVDHGGFYGAPEQCDDGNAFDADGCSSACNWE